MASRVDAGIHHELLANGQRGLWFVQFDPSGGMADTTGTKPRAARRGSRSPARLGVHLMGPPDPAHPSVAREGELEVAFAGRLFNRGDLTTSGEPLDADATNAEVLLRAYRRKGEQGVYAARGAFAAIVSDPERNLFFAARDHVGTSPLFVARAGAGLVFSISTEGVLQHPAVSGELNRAYIVDQLRHAYPDAGETFYRAVRRVMPGHVLRWQQGQVGVTRYFDPLPPGEPVRWLTEEEVEGFADMLDQSVARCLDLGPTAIFLSGGLDSVSVAAVAADVSARMGAPGPLALSLRFPHPDVDEAETQRRVAAQLDLPLVLLDLEDAAGGDGVFPAGVELSGHWPAPQLNPWLPAYGRLAVEGRERGRRVILTGGGGDEWLSVGPYYAADVLRSADVRGMRFIWNAWRGSYRLSNRELARSMWKYGVWPPAKTAIKRGVEAVAPAAVPAWTRWRRSRVWPGWLAPDDGLRRAALEREGPKQEGQAFRHERLSYYLTDGRQALGHVSVSTEMEEDFELGRRLGILEVDPYWDADLVDFLHRTPPELLLRGGRGKGLVRWMLSERFPDLGFESQKKMVSLDYFQQMVLQGTPRAWRMLGGIETLSGLGIVDANRFERELGLILGERRLGQAYRIWDVLTMEAWARGRA